MTTLQLLIVCVTVLAVCALAASSWAARGVPAGPDSECDLPLESNVAVHLLSGSSVRGRVIQSGMVVRLADASAIAGGNTSSLGGTVVIRADRVDWSQEL